LIWQRFGENIKCSSLTATRKTGQPRLPDIVQRVTKIERLEAIIKTHDRALELSNNACVRRERWIAERDTEIDRQLEALEKVIQAWESLPGPRSYSVREVQHWMTSSMKPALDFARAALEPKSEGEG
jgi:hypothetical protein